MYYWTCPRCGSNLDPGEKCECMMARENKEGKMSDLVPIKAIENVGTIEDNLEAVEAAIRERTAEYSSIVVTEDSIKESKKFLADIRKEKKELDDKRKAIKASWMAPYDAFEKRAKRVIDLYDEPIGIIDSQLKAYEQDRKERKKTAIRSAYDELSRNSEYAEYAPLDRFYDPKWENATYEMSKIREDIELEFSRMEIAVSTIKSMESDFEVDGLSTLKKTGDLQEAIRSIADMNRQMERLQEIETERLKAAQKEAEDERKAKEAENGKFEFPESKPEASPQNRQEEITFPPAGEKIVTVKVSISESDIGMLLEYLDALGAEYEVIENA